MSNYLLGGDHQTLSSLSSFSSLSLSSRWWSPGSIIIIIIIIIFIIISVMITRLYHHFVFDYIFLDDTFMFDNSFVLDEGGSLAGSGAAIPPGWVSLPSAPGQRHTDHPHCWLSQLSHLVWVTAVVSHPFTDKTSDGVPFFCIKVFVSYLNANLAVFKSRKGHN